MWKGSWITLLAAALSVGTGVPALADVYSGTLYYTYFTGGQNVWKVGFSYDDATNAASLGTPTNVASTNGADGIIFGPNGNLLIGGQGTGNVYEISPSTGALLNTQSTGTPSFHLTLDPSGNTVYTSDFGGALKLVDIPIGSGVTTRPVTAAASGGDTGVTQVAFGDGSVFYVNGSPNGFGNVGSIDLATGVTTRLYSSVAPAHGIIYDPYTDLMTMFGAGQTGTFDPVDGSGLLTSGQIYGVGDFDQGAVDGRGHALVAGSNAITFIDYRLSGDITKPDFVTQFYSSGGIGFGNIDDVAPLVGPGAGPGPGPGTVPEPGSYALLFAALIAASGAIRRRFG